jgi:hypothetical protein
MARYIFYCADVKLSFYGKRYRAGEVYDLKIALPRGMLLSDISELDKNTL